MNTRGCGKWTVMGPYVLKPLLKTLKLTSPDQTTQLSSHLFQRRRTDTTNLMNRCGNVKHPLCVDCYRKASPHELCTKCLANATEAEDKCLKVLKQWSPAGSSFLRVVERRSLSHPPEYHFSPSNLTPLLEHITKPVVHCIMTGVFDSPVALRVPESLWLSYLKKPEIKPGAHFNLRSPIPWSLERMKTTSVAATELHGVFDCRLHVDIPVSVWEPCKKDPLGTVYVSSTVKIERRD
ncbi:hypothetical protein BJ508DRAFT_356719 [Ascobolus immersus RN42]|uniref:Uncharacterized protein n=1 Tax=Ascobolus immersus RN42 TaxID=1160509 RepID=A0A3N4IP15_ASCIM|nr:hypothetical protein BJ508DRAFT_356719 [Ascobolus immersus RN42]